jgi:signal transduction histidine kinase
MIKILGRGDPDGEQRNKFSNYLALVESETARCSKIVSNLLAFSRKSEFEFREVSIDELLERCVILSRHKMDLQDIKVRLDVGADLPNIWGDFNQIQQCIINLIFNAVDAMPGGGVLTVRSLCPAGEGFVHIRVEDTGCGIQNEDLPHVFDPFFTRKGEGKGLGLGLSTVCGIIERHRGSISVESEPGRGSVFTIRLPVDKKDGGRIRR